MQFMLLCKPQKSGALRAFIPFLEVTQKIPSESDRRDSKLSKNIQCEKNSHSLFFNFPKICKNIDEKTTFLAHFGPLKADYRLFLRLITLHCFFLTLITDFLCV